MEMFIRPLTRLLRDESPKVAHALLSHLPAMLAALSPPLAHESEDLRREDLLYDVAK